MKLWTFGHGTLEQAALAALIDRAGLARVTDVRTVPRSRRHPWVAREAMEVWVPEQTAATYVWARELGGFRRTTATSANIGLRNPSFRGYADYMETPSFRDALHALLSGAEAEPTAVMCSETLWWRCHRRLIADAATLLHGAEVLHLAPDASTRLHALTAGVRLENGVLRYGESAP